MISFLFNGSPLPGTLLANTLYTLEVESDSFDAISQRWEVTAGGSLVAAGTGNVQFVPTAPVPHTISAVLFSSSGTSEEGAVTVQITARGSGGSTVGINWDRLDYRPGDTIGATVDLFDPEGLSPRNINWTIYRNSVAQASGTTARVHYKTPDYGAYRIVATALDGAGETKTGESTLVIQGNFEIKSAIQPCQPIKTARFLGTVYGKEVRGGAATAQTLPSLLATLTQTVYLLPGTTHFKLELTPQSVVDDEVVVRTKLGNWALVGPPGGLETQDTGYDYNLDDPYIPAPGDRKLYATYDLWNTQGLESSAFLFRVAFKCYQVTGDNIYQYSRCAYSVHPGGAAERQRKFAGIFTQIDVLLDADSGQGRVPVTTPQAYVTPEVTSLPLTYLEADGEPYPVQQATGYSFTAANLTAFYEPSGLDLPELPARAIAGLEGARPCVWTLQQPGLPEFVNVVKRLYGTLAIYMARGAVFAGDTITVAIHTGAVYDGEQVVRYTVPVPTTVYNDSDDAFVWVGNVAVDLADYQFDHYGVVMDIQVNAVASTGTIQCPSVPVWGTQTIHGTLNQPSVIFDGACYTKTGKVDVFDFEAIAKVSAIDGCQAFECGPVGLYCYQSVAFGTTVMASVPQPLHNPAPFVAHGNDQFNCYNNPVFIRELTSSGTFDFNYVSYGSSTGSILCGDAYAYSSCEPFLEDIVVLYPYAASAHDFVSYGSSCYGLDGQIFEAGTHTIYLPPGSITAVADCTDALCTGTNATGDSVVYRDNETTASVHVEFPHLDTSIAHYGVAAYYVDYGGGGLTPGSAALRFTDSAVQDVIRSVPASGRLEFTVSFSGHQKKLLVIRDGSTLTYPMSAGSSIIDLNLVAGDRVRLDIGNVAGKLSARTRGARINVTWVPVVPLPRLYQTITASLSGTIQGIGFCGLTDRQPYTFFGTLPADQEVALPNPDTILTVQATGGSEVALIRNRAIGDALPPLPGGVGWYDNSALTGPLTFRFYAAREDLGQHGEMDIYLDTDGSFPSCLKVDDYRVLVLGDDVVRATTGMTDTHRNALVVVSGTSGYHLPRLFAASDGQLISAQATTSQVSVGSKTYDLVVTASGTDKGLSFVIYPASALDEFVLATEDAEVLVTEDSEALAPEDDSFVL